MTTTHLARAQKYIYIVIRTKYNASSQKNELDAMYIHYTYAHVYAPSAEARIQKRRVKYVFIYINVFFFLFFFLDAKQLNKCPFSYCQYIHTDDTRRGIYILSETQLVETNSSPVERLIWAKTFFSPFFSFLFYFPRNRTTRRWRDSIYTASVAARKSSRSCIRRTRPSTEKFACDGGTRRAENKSRPPSTTRSVREKR